MQSNPFSYFDPQLAPLKKRRTFLTGLVSRWGFFVYPSPEWRQNTPAKKTRFRLSQFKKDIDMIIESEYLVVYPGV
jgi:hypothetical protein